MEYNYLLKFYIVFAIVNTVLVIVNEKLRIFDIIYKDGSRPSVLYKTTCQIIFILSSFIGLLAIYFTIPKYQDDEDDKVA